MDVGWIGPNFGLNNELGFYGPSPAQSKKVISGPLMIGSPNLGVLMRRDNSRATRIRLDQNLTHVSLTRARARLEMLTSRVEQLVTRLEKLAINSNIFLYKILKKFLKFYISTLGDDINNISLFFYS